MKQRHTRSEFEFKDLATFFLGQQTIFSMFFRVFSSIKCRSFVKKTAFSAQKLTLCLKNVSKIDF